MGALPPRPLGSPFPTVHRARARARHPFRTPPPSPLSHSPLPHPHPHNPHNPLPPPPPRSYPLVLHLFGVCSHGRRWRRILEYTTDTSRCLGELPAALASLLSRPQPHWQAGDTAHAVVPSTSLVITRSLVYGDRRSVETYVPPRHLAGILPSALLLQYDFWQRPDASLLAQRRGGSHGLPPPNAPDELHIELTLEGTAAVRRVPLDARGAPQSHRERYLLSSARVPRHGALGSLLQLLLRVEDLAHVLLWSNAGDGIGDDDDDDYSEDDEEDCSEDDEGEPSGGTARSPGRADTSRAECAVGLIELPRLRLSFSVVRETCGEGGGRALLRCNEHPGLVLGWLECERLHALLRGLPHALVLTSEAGDVAVLLSALCKPCRLVAPNEPLHTQMLLARHLPSWMAQLPSSRHYLYSVHPSRTYLSPPSLAAALYLLLLRWLARDFEAACALAPSCVTDAPMSAEEAQLWKMLADLTSDAEPAAHACRLKLSLGARACPELACPWEAAKELGCYLAKLSYELP